ncbi:MAG: hypothetical protein AAF441_10610 [Pseudomonadota bacterium]
MTARNVIFASLMAALGVAVLSTGAEAGPCFNGKSIFTNQQVNEARMKSIVIKTAMKKSRARCIKARGKACRRTLTMQGFPRCYSVRNGKFWRCESRAVTCS